MLAGMFSTPSGPIAVLADIHGNTWALDAVLAHASTQGATRLITLGDLAYGPLDPLGAVERIMALDLPAVHISGNEDRVLWESLEPVEGHTSWVFTRSKLDDSHLAWLANLLSEQSIGGLFLCHGAPGHDTEYLLETVTPQGLRPSTREHLDQRLKGIGEDVILCGHSHLPGIAQTTRGALVINPGSVGLQAYTDDVPHFHVVQSKSPHARYALLERGDSGWNVSLEAVPYDWESAARAADLNGRPDWARALRSGWI
jgi:putative phosphoesterase